MNGDEENKGIEALRDSKTTRAGTMLEQNSSLETYDGNKIVKSNNTVIV